MIPTKTYNFSLAGPPQVLRYKKVPQPLTSGESKPSKRERYAVPAKLTDLASPFPAVRRLFSPFLF